MRNIFSTIEKFKANIAFYTNEYKSITYKNLLDDTEKLEKIFKKKEIILIFSENCYEFFVCYVAAIRENQVLMLVNSKTNEVDILDILNRYDPDYVFCQNIKKYKNYSIKLNFGSFHLLKKNQVKKYKINKELSCLLSTSGTTGVKKFVKLSVKNILSNSTEISKSLNINQNDTSITTMPPYYSYALSVINTHLMNGAKIIINNFSLVDRNFWDLFKYYKPNNLNGVPYTFQILDKIKFEKMEIGCLRYITQAGGKLESKLRDKFIETCEKKKIRFNIMYGQAEASPRISIMPWKLLKKFPSSVGRALPGGSVSIDRKRKFNTKEGEIIYRGKNVFFGYSSSNKDLKKKNEINYVLKTGDLGFMNKNKLIFITGRKKRITKIFGIRISLDQLECELKKNNYNCICEGDDSKIIFKLINKKKVNINKFNQVIKNITELSPKFFEVTKAKKTEINKYKKKQYIL